MSCRAIAPQTANLIEVILSYLKQPLTIIYFYKYQEFLRMETTLPLALPSISPFSPSYQSFPSASIITY
jgi:hypothetical protein